jgi:hypothetical protein
MKTYEGMEVKLHDSWPRYWMEVSDHLHVPAVLPPGERAPGTLWIGDGLDAVDKRKNVALQEIEPGPSST